jgi:hypothetical protein
MVLDKNQRITSADDQMDIHVLPADLLETRLPSAHRERDPRVVEAGDGPFWQVEGKLLSPSGSKSKDFIGAEDHGFRPVRPETRLPDRDRDGIFGQIVYGIG